MLANIYLHLLDRIVNKAGSLYRANGVKIVRYADDFVLMGRKIPEAILERTHSLLTRMGLEINEEKSRVLDASTMPFQFLGFQIRYDRDMHGRNKRYWNIVPSPKSNKQLRRKIGDYLKTAGHYPAEVLAHDLNMKLRGWLNYFTIEGVSYPAMSKRNLRWYLVHRLYRFYRRKSQRHSELYCQRAFEVLVKQYGLIDPTTY